MPSQCSNAHQLTSNSGLGALISLVAKLAEGSRFQWHNEVDLRCYFLSVACDLGVQVDKARKPGSSDSQLKRVLGAMAYTLSAATESRYTSFGSNNVCCIPER